MSTGFPPGAFVPPPTECPTEAYVSPSQGGPFPDGSPAGQAQYRAQLAAAATYQRDPTLVPSTQTVEAFAALAVVPTEAPAKKSRAKKAPAGTGAAQISPELAASLEAKRQAYAGVLLQIQNAPLNTQQEVDFLSETAAECKAEFKALDEQMESITKPLNAALTAARRMFKPPMEFLKSCEAAIKGRIESRLQEQRALQASALRLVQDNRGQVAAEVMATAVGTDLVKAPEGSYEVETWSCEITDATQLPAAYWIPNFAMLEDLAKRQKDQARVPGVRFFATKALRIRTA